MRQLMKWFGQNYSAVQTQDQTVHCMETGGTAGQQQKDQPQQQQTTSNNESEKYRKSLQAKRSLTRGFSIVDFYFSKRTTGKSGFRWPKGMRLNFILIYISYVFIIFHCHDDLIIYIKLIIT